MLRDNEINESWDSFLLKKANEGEIVSETSD